MAQRRSYDIVLEHPSLLRWLIKLNPATTRLSSQLLRPHLIVLYTYNPYVCLVVALLS